MMHVHYQVRMNRPGHLKRLIILFFLIPLATALSFNFTSFPANNTDMIYQGSTIIASNSIQLTLGQPQSVARAMYTQPLHLWDRASGNLTDFTTHFSFAISSNMTRYGDGFTFLLVPQRSTFPDNANGSRLGLTGLWNSTEIRLVAVEFDLFPNKEIDPDYQHVGIDINNLSSVVNTRWDTGDSILEGWEQEAWISYDSQLKTLSVRFTDFTNGSPNTKTLFHVVDLRSVCPEFVTFGFSASTGGGNGVIQKINSWSFSSNFPRPNSNSKKAWVIIGSAIGGSAVVVALGLFAFILWMRRKWTINETDQIRDEFENRSISKEFKYNELKAATSNFAEQHKLGEGGFGSVYKGFLRESTLYVAVKRISSDSKQGMKEFVSEVKTASTLRHRNLVQLLGWCHEKKELLLVYELMPEGSLDLHLFKGKSLLDWTKRFSIVKGVASALLYLHEEWDQYVVHRDIKASNIMLDSNFKAKLGDFGLAKLIDRAKAWETTLPSGTRGYMAPEYEMTGKASKETDVYSFGIVALETASGRKSRQFKSNGDVINLTELVWDLYLTEKLIDAADPQLNSDFKQHEMRQLLCIGLWCAHPDRNSRPSIRQVIRVLDFEAPLPVLPVPIEILSPLYETDVSRSYITSVKASSSLTL